MSFRERGDDDGRRLAVGRIKAAVGTLLALTDDDTITVSELRCTEPGCPPLETVVTVLRPGQPRQMFKVHRPLGDVSDADLHRAMRGHDHEPPP